MSLVSQTPAKSRVSPRVVIMALGAAAVVGLALSPVGSRMVRAAEGAGLHGPDMSVFAALSPVVKVHLITALAALLLGAALMVMRKGRLFHRTAGWLWVGLVSITAGSTLFITSFSHGKWSWLHLFTGWTLIILPLAVMAAKRRKLTYHRRAMMGLFYGGFALNLVFAALPGRTLWNMFLG